MDNHGYGVTSGGNGSLVDPAERLPTEILGEIFLWCDPLPDAGGFSMQYAPWLLTHVSRRWRAVAISTPALWRKISVDMVPLTDLERMEAIFQLTFLVLQRSAQSPISVLIAGDNMMPNWPVLHLLMSTCERWDDLRLYADGVIICALTPIRGRLHQLLRLDIFRSDDDTPSTVLDIFHQAPSLREVSLAHDSYLTIPLPWNQLTEFSTAYIDLAPIVSTLRELVNLEVLTLDRLEGSETVRNFYPFQLPRLRELTITADHGQDGHPGGLLDHLSLPALVCLSLDCEDITICPHLTTLITRSACHLDSLSLSIYDTLDTPIATVLALTPHLTALELKGNGTTDTFLAQLTRAPSALAPALVPRLEALTLNAPFNQALLLDLVSSRFAPDPESGDSDDSMSGDNDDPSPSDPVCALRFLRVDLLPAELEPVLAYGLPPLYDMGLKIQLLRST
ncbi:hypothetical protein DFH06DRAFT_262610 [Mycena polygramma]|nr:hypothetical protein DFH06DRAFT_262610 [Mycena polygramma]